MTATAIAVKYIDIKAEDDVETEIVPVVATGELKYTDLGNNIYSVQALMSDGTAVDTNTLILAGQDRDPAATEDNNLLSGRTKEKGGSIAVANIYPESDDITNRITKEAYYTIEGADSAYYVTAGSDGLLGTWDDIIKDSSGKARLGTYDLDLDDEQEVLGWEFVSGSSVREMLLVTEYVLDQVMFNDETEGHTTSAYANSTLMAKMQEIYIKAKGTKTAIQQNVTISMADYTDEVTLICTCTVESHIDDTGHHKDGMTGCTIATIETGGKANLAASLASQADITGVTFFALSVEEVAEAYNDANPAVSRDYCRGKYAKCGGDIDIEVTTYNGTKFCSASYWFRSPGSLSTYASGVKRYGEVFMDGTITHLHVGARPACYATLA
jgi:hypothetical protein